MRTLLLWQARNQFAQSANITIIRINLTVDQRRVDDVPCLRRRWVQILLTDDTAADRSRRPGAQLCAVPVYFRLQVVLDLCQQGGFPSPSSVQSSATRLRLLPLLFLQTFVDPECGRGRRVGSEVTGGHCQTADVLALTGGASNARVTISRTSVKMKRSVQRLIVQVVDGTGHAIDFGRHVSDDAAAARVVVIVITQAAVRLEWRTRQHASTIPAWVTWPRRTILQARPRPLTPAIHLRKQELWDNAHGTRESL